MLMKTASSIPIYHQPRKLVYAIGLFLGFHIFFLSTEYSNDNAQLRRFAAETMETVVDEDPSSLQADSEQTADSFMSLESTNQDADRKTYSFSNKVERMQMVFDEGFVPKEDDANDKNKVIESMRTRRAEKEQKVDVVKPKMYTFLATDEGDDEMLGLWKEEWTAAGFETHILSLEDAKLHPRFAEFEEKLQNIPLNTLTKTYDQMRYFRHLAMASVGGGYMSDYDVLPMIDRPISDTEGQEAKNDVYLTSNNLPIDFSCDEDITSYNSFVPSLMSGSASKWDNFAFQLLENGLQHSDETLWVDMFAMLDLQIESQYLYKSLDIVLGSFPLQEEWTEDLCTNTRRYIAAHFSHQVFKAAKVGVEKRAQFAKKWLGDWRFSCSLDTSTI